MNAPPLTRRAAVALRESRALHIALLALPFLAVAVALGGLSGAFPAYQFGDERTHFEAVRRFAEAFPVPLLNGYGTNQGPLAYWLLAALSLPLGGTLAAARLVVAVMSWGACAVAYVTLRDRLGARPLDALGLSLGLATSAFFFGESFRVFTDNPAWLLVAVALERSLAYAAHPRLRTIALGAAAAGAAALMRQSSAWAFAPLAVALALAPAPPRSRAWGAGMLAAGLAPLAALVAAWGGSLLPPPGYPPLTPVDGPPWGNLVMTLGLLAVCLAATLPVAEAHRLLARAGARGLVAPAVAVAATVAVLAVVGIPEAEQFTPPWYGWLGLLATATPVLAGTSVVWWGLGAAGAGGAALLALGRTSRADRVLLAAGAALLATTLVNRWWLQRYVDFPLLLLCACLAVSSTASKGPADRLRWWLLAPVGIGWAALLAVSL